MNPEVTMTEQAESPIATSLSALVREVDGLNSSIEKLEARLCQYLKGSEPKNNSAPEANLRTMGSPANERIKDAVASIAILNRRVNDLIGRVE